MLYLIGLGLGDVKDITVRGLETVRQCARVWMEAYTSILMYQGDVKPLEEFYGRSIELADREFVEQGCGWCLTFRGKTMLDAAVKDDVALLVVGDPFGFTFIDTLSHENFFDEKILCVKVAESRGIRVAVIHNASIMNACGCTGIQLYNLGATVSVCFWDENWKPDSYFDKVVSNHALGLHTLCLLDIKVKEQSVENLMKGRAIYEAARYMTCAQAAAQFIQIIHNRKLNSNISGLNEDSLCVGLARVGWPDQQIAFGTLRQLSERDIGPPLHCLIICAHLHPMELQSLNNHKLID